MDGDPWYDALDTPETISYIGADEGAEEMG